MANNVYAFRRVKHADPVKLKVLVEDFTPRRATAFILLVSALSIFAFALAAGII